jgi:rhodanese-related sulfurtransferase/DNA-binding transcriptional ArsR family regulator
MGDRPSKDALYDGLASVAKALGSGRRAELVDVLAQAERHVDDLADEIGQSVANTSHHLQTLLRAGLVRTRRDGTRVYYALASEQVTEMWMVMRDVATTHAANVDRLADDYLGDRSDLDVITRDQLLDRLGAGDVVVLDVRPHVEFAAGHVAGAINIPADDLAAHLRQLPDGKQVVAYCRGPLCVLSVDAVRLLRNAGRPAVLLEDGYPEWAGAGLPVERASA